MADGIMTHPSAASWKTSVQTPPTGSLARERLTRALADHFDAQRRHGPVAMLVAPAGYGKTTVLAQWAQSSLVPVAWYTLDQTDNDLAYFLRGVTYALGDVVLRPHWRALLALDSLQAGIPSPSDRKRLTDLFVHDLRRIIRQPATLALTNLHTLQPGGSTAELLDRLLTEQPDLLGLALESRTPWDIPAPTARQEQRLLVLNAGNLALRDDERQALLGLRGATQETRLLHPPYGDAIMAILLAAGKDAPAERGACRQDARPEAPLEELARREIDALTAVERAVAARVAILDPVAPLVCARLLDTPDAGERLAALAERLTCFDAVAVVGAETIYRFQPALLAGLLRALQEGLDVAELHALHARAGDILRDACDHEAAVGHYAEAQRYDRILALIDERRSALLRAGQGETIVRWIQALPATVGEAYPRLLTLLANLQRVAGRSEDAWQATRLACALALPPATQEPELAARALLARGMLAHDQGDNESARADCARALELAPADAADLQIDARFGLLTCLAALGPLEQHDDLLSALERRAQETRDVASLNRYWYLRSKASQADLRYVASARACEQALRFAQDAEDAEITVVSQIQLGMMLACQGDYDEALRLVDSAREQARRAGYGRHMAYAVASVGDIERMRGAYADAIAGYYRAQTLTERLPEPRLLAYVLSGLGYSYTLNGRSDLAVSLLRDDYERGPDPLEQSGWARKALALGVAWLREGEPATAANPIEHAYALASSADDPSLLLDARLILSALRLAQGRDAEASAEIVAALDRLMVEDVAPVLLPTAQIVAEIFPLIEHIKGERAEALLAALARAERSRLVRAEGQTTQPVLRLYTFGGPRVFEGSIQVRGWRLPAALEMLCYLLDRREPTPKETILADLWPGKTEQIANINFRQAVFQLNRVLDRKSLVKRDRRWALTFECWVDAHEFERLHQEGERLAAAGELRPAIGAFRRALSYYRGAYLPDLDSAWARRRAEWFSQVYLSCLDQLAALEERLGRHDDAAQHWFQSLVSHAPHESASRGLMRYYARRQEYENVRDQYERLQRALGLERAPSAETEALYLQLRAAAPATTSAHDL